jgi:Clustered mitochondria
LFFSFLSPSPLPSTPVGKKYICQGILFKFAMDVELRPGLWMYGGDRCSNEKAMKAASHEMKGLMCYYQSRTDNLHLPLMCLVHFRGFCLLASSILPISHSTIRYGSMDAGRQVHASDAELCQLMRQAASKINIAPHLVSDKTLYGPGDIEGHRGSDGKLYLIDFSRVMPCEAPGFFPNAQRRAIFYNLLRPTLVKTNLKPLSSDAFSAWSSADPRRSEANSAISQVP